jgi:23S rRNA pseudouridine1911/1915/1917 synthase
MRFIEVQIPSGSELGEFILAYFKSHKAELTKEQLTEHVKSHLVYFQNKPVPFLPFKVFKKGKAQIYLDIKGFDATKSIIYEDKWILAINKPSGIPSQSSLKLLQDHAFSAVQCYLRNKKFQSSPPLFLLHRLDTDTSGVLLFSKKASANKEIQTQFETRSIEKSYIALSTSKDKKPQSKKIESYLARRGDKKHAFKFASVNKNEKGSKRAETEIKHLESVDDKHLFLVLPKTGRSHQIRVHLKEEGFPILGDPFYDGEKASHLHLHAWKLSFKHPISTEALTIEAPLPQHMAQSLDKFNWSL